MARRRRFRDVPQPVGQPIPARLWEAQCRWCNPFAFATVQPTTHGWTVYEVRDAGLRFVTTEPIQRRSYPKLDLAMAAAERRNRVLRRREAELDAELDAAWPLHEGPLPWHPPPPTELDRPYVDALVRWHLDRCAARAGAGDHSTRSVS